MNSSCAEPLRLALLLRNLDRRRSRASNRPVVARRGGLLLRPQRERVLIAARHPVLLGDVLRGLSHRVGAVLRLHLRIHEAPAEARVEQLDVARERLARPSTSRTARASCSRRRRRCRSRPRRASRARAAFATALMPDAHSRFTVSPGTVTGSPASSSAMRATLRLSSPAWFAQPRMTSVIARGIERRIARARARRSTCAARSSARTSLRPPPMLPIGRANAVDDECVCSFRILKEVPDWSCTPCRETARRSRPAARAPSRDRTPSRFVALSCCAVAVSTSPSRHAFGYVIEFSMLTVTLAVRVRRERQRAVGERERDAAVAHAEAVQHVRAHRHPHRRGVRAEPRRPPSRATG